jgi:YggT family protein
MFHLLGFLIKLLLNIYIIAILANVLMRYFQVPARLQFWAEFARDITEPLLNLIRRVVPPTKLGIDVSPAIAIFGLMLLQGLILTLISGARAIMAILLKLLLLLYFGLIVISLASRWMQYLNPNLRATLENNRYFQKGLARVPQFVTPVVEIIKNNFAYSYRGIDLAPFMLMGAVLLLMMLL